MRLPVDMLFIPVWLGRIQPTVPVGWLTGPEDPVYPPSSPPGSAITPASLEAKVTGRQDWVSGQAMCSGTILDGAELARTAQARRAARKARRTTEMMRGVGWRRRADARVDHRVDRIAQAMEAKAVTKMEARQAAREESEELEAREERRADAFAAFACDSPTWCDGIDNDCWQCPYGKKEGWLCGEVIRVSGESWDISAPLRTWMLEMRDWALEALERS